MYCYGDCEVIHKRSETLDINYAVTLFPGLLAVADPTPQALFREEWNNERSAARRDRRRKAKGTTNFARLDIEREINAVRAFSQS